MLDVLVRTYLAQEVSSPLIKLYSEGKLRYDAHVCLSRLFPHPNPSLLSQFFYVEMMLNTQPSSL